MTAQTQSGTQPTSSTTTGLQVDLRTVTDYSQGLSSTGALPTTSQNLVRQVMCVGDPAVANLVADVVNSQPTGNENALMVALMPNNKDYQEIKELLFQILQAIERNNAALGAAPTSQTVEPGI